MDGLPQRDESLITNITNTLRSFVDVWLMDNGYLVFIELLESFIIKFLDYFGILSPWSVLKKKRLRDTKTLLPGDIIWTPDHRYVIVSQVRETKEMPEQDKEKGNIRSRASLSEGNTVLPSPRSMLDLLEISSESCLKTLENRKKETISSVVPGDVISFTDKGLNQKGIVSEKWTTPNNRLSINYLCLSEDGVVTRKNGTYNLDQDEIFKFSIKVANLDGDNRDGLLYTAECMLGRTAISGYFARSTSCDFVKECASELARLSKIPIQIEEIKLKTEIFQRIQNIRNWMKKNSCIDVPDKIRNQVPRIRLNPAVFVLSKPGFKIEEIFEKRYILERQIKVLRSPWMGYQNITEKCNDKDPIFMVCVITCDKYGNFETQDNILIDLTNLVNRTSVDVLYILNSEDETKNNDLRKLVSGEIKKRTNPASEKNNAFHKLFFHGDCDILKRISASFEHQINCRIKKQSQIIRSLQNGQEENGKDADTSVVEYCRKINQLETFVLEEDPYKQHILEVLLQRNPDVKAFSLNNGEVQIFTNEKESIEQYINEFSAEKFHFTFKKWPGSPKVSRYHLKQGSKVHERGRGEKYGTLGMFVQDNDGNTYFTTCAHVINELKEAFTEGNESAVGKSVFAQNMSETVSITDSLDLSLVKVYKNKIQSCGFGLRNTDNVLVEGTVSVAEKHELKEMKVYKWGAKTELTRGIYKGSLCLKKGEKIDSCLHYIQGNINKREFAKEGDSGSLICFEATGSPQFPGETAAFILFGECTSGKEYLDVGNESFAGCCYHVSQVLNCIDGQRADFIPHLTPSTGQGNIQQGSSLASNE